MKSKHNMQGFTLVEILIAMSLGSVLLFVCGQIMLQAAKTNRIAHQQSLMQEASAVAKLFLERDIRRAGYYGGLENSDAFSGTAKVQEFSNQCKGGDENFALMLYPSIYGLNNSREDYQCIENYVHDTDVLTLRYLQPIKKIEGKSSERHKLYARVSNEEGKVFKAMDEAHYRNQLTGKPADIFVVKSYVYYLRDTGRSCDNVLITGLYREYINNKGFMTAEEIVSGVEQMQIRFVVNGKLKNAKEISIEEWDDVEAVSVSLLLRAECPESIPNLENSFVLQDYEFMPQQEKSFMRQSFHFDIALRN